MFSFFKLELYLNQKNININIGFKYSMYIFEIIERKIIGGTKNHVNCIYKSL